MGSIPSFAAALLAEPSVERRVVAEEDWGDDEARGGPPRDDPAARRAALAATLSSGRELLQRRRREMDGVPLPTGLPLLDDLLGGGLPRRCLVELVGRASSGRLASVLSLLARTTSDGEVAALVDLGDALAPGDAIAAGVDLARLLWLRPLHLREALAAAETTLQGGFPLVVVELGLPPIPGGRGAEASWLRLARAATAHGAALLVASPYRLSGTAAEVVVEASRAGVRWRRLATARSAPPLLAGLALALALAKHRRQPEASDRGWGRATLRLAGDLLADLATESVAVASEAPPRTDEASAAARASGRPAPPSLSLPRSFALRPASATARRGWRAQAPRSLGALGQRLRAGETAARSDAAPAATSR